MLTTADIARRLGVSPRRVLAIAKQRGISPARWVGASALWHQRDLPRFTPKRPKPQTGAA